MSPIYKKLTCLLLVLCCTWNCAFGAGVVDYQDENLNQRMVETPQEEIVPPDLQVGARALQSNLAVEDTTVYASPLDVSANSTRNEVYVADYTGKKVRVIDVATNSQIGEIPLGESPTALLTSADGATLYVAAGGATGKVYIISTQSSSIRTTISVGHTPSALALSEDESTLYVANRFSGNLQVIDLVSGAIVKDFYVTREPMSMVRVGTKLFLASHIVTGSAQEDVVSSDVVMLDLTAEDISKPSAQKIIPLLNGSTNVKDMAASPDGQYLYISHALGRYNVATTQADRGWIYNNALTEIRISSGAVTATMMLDDLDWGAGNPWGVAVTDEQIAVAISGTHELMILDRVGMRAKIDSVTNGSYWNGKNQALKYQGYLQNADDIANDLTFLATLKTRVKLYASGPRGVAVLNGNAYVADYFGGAVSVVSLKNPKATDIQFTTAAESDARTGERLWNDATIGFQQWQSCASCHPDARVDGLNWDNLNDGIGTPKQARTMLNTFDRGRVMSTGIRANAKVAVRAGLKYIMFNANYPEENLEKIDAYVQSLVPEQSPYLENGYLSESALRGKVLFEGEAGCAQCHKGAIKGQDKLVYNYTQTGNESRGLLVPPLLEVWRTAPYLYDGRASSISEVLTTYNPGYESGNGKHGKVNGLSQDQLEDLENYVLSLPGEEDYGMAKVDDLMLVNTGESKLGQKDEPTAVFDPEVRQYTVTLMPDQTEITLRPYLVYGPEDTVAPEDAVTIGGYPVELVLQNDGEATKTYIGQDVTLPISNTQTITMEISRGGQQGKYLLEVIKLTAQQQPQLVMEVIESGKLNEYQLQISAANTQFDTAEFELLLGDAMDGFTNAAYEVLPSGSDSLALGNFITFPTNKPVDVVAAEYDATRKVIHVKLSGAGQAVDATNKTMLATLYFRTNTGCDMAAIGRNISVTKNADRNTLGDIRFLGIKDTTPNQENSLVQILLPNVVNVVGFINSWMPGYVMNGKVSIDIVDTNGVSLLKEKKTSFGQGEFSITIPESTREYTVVISLPGYLEARVDMADKYQVGAVALRAGDMDGDGDIDATDHQALILRLHSTVEKGTLGDINGDGKINASDFSCLLIGIKG